MKYIDAEKLKNLIDKKWKELADKNVKVGGGKWDVEISTYLSVLRLITSLQQEQPEMPSGEDVMVMCNQILIDWVKDGKTQEEKEQREQAHIRFFELYDDYLMQEQPEVDLEKEIEFECIGKNVKMTVQELINYYIDTECAETAIECGF